MTTDSTFLRSLLFRLGREEISGDAVVAVALLTGGKGPPEVDIRQVEIEGCGRAWIVGEKKKFPGHLVIPPIYCSCRAFFEGVLSNNLCCKHELAVLMRRKESHSFFENLSDKQLGLIYASL